MRINFGSPFLLGGLISSTLASPSSRLLKRGDEPKLPYDPNTFKGCSWWFEYDTEMSCEEILSYWFVYLEDFILWNPSLSGQCEGLQLGRSYCVEGWGVIEEDAATTTATSVETPTPTPIPKSTASVTPRRRKTKRRTRKFAPKTTRRG